MSEKTAIVLFNMGGPDKPQSIRPFLRNLFADRAIINLPGLVRLPLAEFISRSREKQAQLNYAHMGGKSPILAQSIQQARAVEQYLQTKAPQTDIRCFVAMRYWAPKIGTVQQEIKAWGAKEIILLPLYPQFSHTTTGTFFTAWDKQYGVSIPAKRVVSYAQNAQFIDAHVQNITEYYHKKNCPDNIRLIMSAHGLPEKNIQQGDPYQRQIEQSCALIAKALPEPLQDIQIAYQSRVGPLRWIGPATLEAIEQASKLKKSVMIVPIAFVSEHIETLVELDIDYRTRAMEMGISKYFRVPALGIAPKFIAALGDLALDAIADKTP
jgi:protoporphyrin/coproporphyrin ferrochelatase